MILSIEESIKRQRSKSERKQDQGFPQKWKNSEGMFASTRVLYVKKEWEGTP